MNKNYYGLSKKERLQIHKTVLNDCKSKFAHHYSHCDSLKLILIVALFYGFLTLICLHII